MRIGRLNMSEVERNVRASAVMEFAEIIAGAYIGGFINNHPTVYDIYRSAQNHVKDHYQIETDVWDDEHAKESRSDTYEKLVEKNKRLAKALSEIIDFQCIDGWEKYELLLKELGH